MPQTEPVFEPAVTVETRLTKQDYRRFLYFTLYFRKTFFIPAALICSLLVGMLWGTVNTGFHLPLFLSGFLGTLCFLTAVLVIRVEWRLHRRIKQDTEGTFEKYDTIRFGDVLVEIDSQVMNASGQCGYDRFRQVLETNSQFLLYPDPRICSIIPKHNMTAEDQAALRALLRKNTGLRYQRRRWSV